MARQVFFAVNCADTRLGFHVRVVGSCAALGSWNPPAGLPLSTSATDFPLWRSSSATSLDQDEVIEYKYVICNNEGRVVRWEERPNRTLHLTAVVSRGLVLPKGWITVVEAFNTSGEPEENRFRSSGSSSVPRSSSTLTRLASRVSHEGSQVFDREAAAGAGGDGADLFAPTIRARSSICIHNEHPTVQAMRSASKSFLALGVEDETPEVSGESLPAVSGGGDSEAGATTLVREESCSNLFVDADADEHMKDTSEFEDRYSLVGNGPLGEGTFGLVWRCIPKGREASNGETKEMAAKIVRKARLQPRDMRYLLGEDGEVRTHLTMKHPHIIELFEFFDEPHTVTLVLEYCRGGDLFDAIVKVSKDTGRGFLERAAAIVTKHVLSALVYVHGQKVVHRDIKCENVLLKHQGVPVEENVFKLCDFGFAAHDRGEGLIDRLGSPDTVAPEVVQGVNYSTPADLWSTGVLIYMMLSAMPPFYATTDSEVLRRVRTGSYSLSGEPWDSIGAPPKTMISSLMTVDPNLRPTAASALQMEWLRDLPPNRTA